MIKAIRSKFFILMLAVSPAVAADDLLERLEAATEQIGANQGKFYISRVPELEGKLPDWEWDDEIRSATRCVLDGIKAAKGQLVAEAYVAGIEMDAQKEITSMSQLGQNLPAELSGDDRTILSLTQTCGTMELSIARMEETGFLDALNDPTVMRRLVNDAE